MQTGPDLPLGKIIPPQQVIEGIANTFVSGMKEGTERPSLLTSLRLDLESVEAGVPVETITSFVLASGVELKDVNSAVISARALRYRRSRKQSLSLDESDRLARLARIFYQAVSVFGDAERCTWKHQRVSIERHELFPWLQSTPVHPGRFTSIVKG